MRHSPRSSFIAPLGVLCLVLFGAGTAESKNPVVSQWMKNLSYTTALEPSGTVWHDEFGDVRAVGKTVHTLWYSLKYNPQDDRFVYRRSVDEGATWKAPVVIATGSEVPDSYLLRDENAGYLCVSGKTVHIVIARYFPEAGDTKWHWKLYYYRSTDNGASFEPGREVANSTGHHSLSQPRIACNDQRVVIGYKVAANWYDNYAIPLLISSDAGQSFRKVRTTATDAYAGNFEDLALNGTDIYVLHYRLLEPYYYGNFQARIGICSSSNDGASFTNRWLTTPAADKRYYALSTKDQYYAPDLAVVGSTVSVIWAQLDTDYHGTKMLMFRQSLDKGKTFGPSRILYRGDSLYSGRETIAAKGNYLFVTFPTSDGSLRLRRSEDGGATFKPTQVVSNEGGLWPEVQFAPDVPSGKTFYLFWDNPSFRRSVTGGATFDKVLWHHPVFTTGNYQRSQRVLTSGHKLHTLTSGQFYSASLCGGYCDRDVFYRSIFPAPSPGGAGSALRLYTETKPFEDRADNMQALSKTLDITGAFTAEIWVKDLGGGITTGYSDYHTPIFFKQRDLSQSYRPAYAIGTIASYGDRRIVADLETTEGSHRLTAQGDAGLLPANIWTHLALVYRPAAAADNLQLFKNGQLVAAATVTGKVVPGFGNLFVGRYGNWLVDELRIWGLPRSASELQTGMKGPLVGNETGLNAYFNFDGTTQDITGKGNHGLLMYKERYAAGRY